MASNVGMHVHGEIIEDMVSIETCAKMEIVSRVG